MYDAGSRKDVRKAEKDAKLFDRQRQEVITGVMQSIPGRSWVLDLLEACHIFRTSYSAVAVQMAFTEGQRDIGLRLLNDIMQSCPDQYILMMRERNERRVTSERTGSSDGNGRNQGPEPTDDPDDIYTDPDDDRTGGGYDREAIDRQ